MKQLKFSPPLAIQMLNGSKRVTWRLFDDKNLTVGDVIECVNSATGEVFAQVEITRMVEKKIQEVTNDEMAANSYRDLEHVLNFNRKIYYGDRVDGNTMVKIVEFSVLNRVKELIKEVLAKGYIMSLGTHDEGGVWVSDVVYIADDQLRMYWISSAQTRHSRALSANGSVSGAITISGPGEPNMGVQFSGTATQIQGPRWDLAKPYYRKLNKPEPREDDDILRGRSWYQLTPSTIDLIYEPLYGFEKQKLEL